MSTALIWGAGGGIGRSVSNLLKANDWQVVEIGRNSAIECDNVANPAQVQQAIYEAQFEVDAVDLMIFTVGDIVQKKVEEMDSADFARILDANLTGAFLATHATLPLLAPDAHLVYLGAVSERLRLPGLSAYVAAKTGLEAFIAALAKEQRKRRFTIVRPGAVDTDFWDKVQLRKPKDAAHPDKVAAKILEAHQNGLSGMLDMTH